MGLNNLAHFCHNRLTNRSADVILFLQPCAKQGPCESLSSTCPFEPLARGGGRCYLFDLTLMVILIDKTICFGESILATPPWLLRVSKSSTCPVPPLARGGGRCYLFDLTRSLNSYLLQSIILQMIRPGFVRFSIAACSSPSHHVPGMGPKTRQFF